MVVLDRLENEALHHLLRLIDEASSPPRPRADVTRLSRGMDGHVIVPFAVDADEPSLPLALLAARKAEQVHKQTGCRFIVAQQPSRDPEQRTYVWGEGRWETVP